MSTLKHRTNQIRIIMKNNYLIKLVLCAFLAVSTFAEAQLNTPRGSQMATVTQRVGTTDISITYSRPSVNGREVWGKLVPYGMNNLGFGTAKESPWRAGANENTTISFTDDVTFEGKPVAAGTYGLHIVVNENNKATIILSSDTDAWGSYFYDPANDVARADVTTEAVPHKELLTYEFNKVDKNSATAALVWEKKAIPFKVEVDVTNIVLNDIRGKLKGQTGFTRQNWEQAANFALNNGGDMEEALGWINGAIEGNFFSQKTFNNMAVKAQILGKMGDSEGSAKAMDGAAELANANQLNRLGYAMMNNKKYDTALKYFKMNVDKDPKNANWHDSLGECYKAMGEKKSAIKHFKKSLALNPPANVKANSEKNLKELGVL